MRQRNEAWKIIGGILLLIGMHTAFWLLYLLISLLIILLVGFQSFVTIIIINYITTIFFYGFIFIGLIQLIYVIPIVFWLKRRQRWGLMKGIIIGAILTALLNGGCFLWWFLMSR